MPDPVKRSWFRFSLRTMLIVVTLFAVWLGWQRNIVASRRAMRDQLHDPTVKEVDGELIGSRTGWYFVVDADAIASVPFWRKWMGDEAIAVIVIPRSVPMDEVEKTRRAFPESYVWCWESESMTFVLPVEKGGTIRERQ